MRLPDAAMLLLCSLALLVSASASVEILDLKQEASSLNSITLTWSLSPADAQPEVYTLLIDGLINQFPGDNTLTHVATGLASCTEYEFQLTATVGGVDTAPATTTGSTSYETPQGISELHVDENANALEWTAPGNEKCVDHYKVCWRSMILSNEFCDTSDTTSYSLTAMSGCDTVHANVSAVSGGPAPVLGPDSDLHFETAYGDPGPPQNFEVSPLPGFAAKLTWDNPEENAACIIDNDIQYGIYGAEDARGKAPSGRQQTRIDNEALVANLSACTNYLFGLSFISLHEVHSESAHDNMTTDYLSPEEISGVHFEATTDTITVTWDEATQNGCLAFLEICYEDATTKETECLNATDPQLDREVVITGLGACRHYEFAVAGVSVTGEFGPPTTHEVVMQDLAPGPVQDLEVETVSPTSLWVTYEPPLLRPECVVEYVVSHMQILPSTANRAQAPSAPAPAARAGPAGRSNPPPVRGTAAARTAVGDAVRQSLARARSDAIMDEITGLEACSDYNVTVHAASGSHQAGNETSVSSRTMDEKPGPPTDPSTVLTTDTSITFTFFAPHNRFCASAYKISYSIQHSGEAEQFITLDNSEFALERMVTLQDLEHCATYIINISSVGISSLGDSNVAVLTQATDGCP